MKYGSALITVSWLMHVFACGQLQKDLFSNPTSAGASTAGVSTILMGGSIQGAPLNLSGVVTTPFGPTQGTTTAGDTDGMGNAARFSQPSAIATDGSNLYVADRGNNKIRRIVIATGVVTTLAGPAQGCFNTCPSGDTDGTGNAARFSLPAGLTTDGINLYVADSGNNKIRKIVIATGVVTTLAGPAQGATTAGDTDGTTNAARFNSPQGITTDGVNIYVADASDKIRQIVISTGVVTTLAGPAQGCYNACPTGDADGVGAVATFLQPVYLTTDGTNLYVPELNNNKIRKIVIATGLVTTPFGPSQGTTTAGDVDGTGNAIRFNRAGGIVTDGTNLFVSDNSNSKIRQILLTTGSSTTLAGPAQGCYNTCPSADTDGTGNTARFLQPASVTSDGVSLYLTAANQNKIRKIQ